MVTVNVVVLAGTVAADPVERRMPSGDEVTELRLSVPEAGKRLLPLPGRGSGTSDVGQARPEAIAQGRRRAGVRPARPSLLPERSRSAEPHRGGRRRDQEARAGRRPTEARVRVTRSGRVQVERSDDQARTRLRPEERRLRRQALAALDHGADPRGVGRRQEVGGNGLPVANGVLGLHRVGRVAELRVGASEHLFVERADRGRRARELRDPMDRGCPSSSDASRRRACSSLTVSRTSARSRTRVPARLERAARLDPVEREHRRLLHRRVGDEHHHAVPRPRAVRCAHLVPVPQGHRVPVMTVGDHQGLGLEPRRDLRVRLAHPEPVLDPRLVGGGRGGLGSSRVVQEGQRTARSGPRNTAWMLDRLVRTARISRRRSSIGPGIVRSCGTIEPPQSSSSTAQTSPRIVRRRPCSENRISYGKKRRTVRRDERTRSRHASSSEAACLYLSSAPPSPAPFGPRTRRITLYGLASRKCRRSASEMTS